MTFYLTDPDGDRLEIEPADRVEDLIKGLRETARELAAHSNGSQT